MRTRVLWPEVKARLFDHYHVDLAPGSPLILEHRGPRLESLLFPVFHHTHHMRDVMGLPA